MNRFNVIIYFKSFTILYNRNCFFNHFLDNLNFRNFYNSLYDFFLDNRDLNYFFNNLFNRNDFFLYDFNLLRLLLNMVNYSLNFNNFFHLNYFLYDCRNLYYFWYFLVNINYFLYNCWNFNNLMDNLLNWHNFLNNLLLNNWNL